MKTIKILTTTLLLLALVGCSQTTKEDGELNIVTSFFPVQSLTEELIGHEVSVIVEGGGDPHDFEPTAKQRVSIAEADLFLYHGAGFEFWFEPSMVTDGESIELSKGMELLEDLDHDAHGHDAVDPHTWLDPSMAKIMLFNIYDAVTDIDPDNQELYESNFEKTTQRLDLLIKDYMKLKQADNTNMVVDHHAYGYLAQGYNLNQEAIIEGVADGDVSFKQTERAIEQIKELGVKAIFVDPSYRNDIVDTIVDATNVEVLDLYTLEQKIDDRSYLDMLQANFDNLSKGLGLDD